MKASDGVERRMKKGGALKAMTKMTTLPTKRSVPFVSNALHV